MKKSKNKIIYILLAIILLVILALILFKNFNQSQKFYLNSEYYNSKGIVKIDSKKVKELQNNKTSYILFTNNLYCTFKIPCETIFEEYSISNNVEILNIPFEDFKNTEFYNNIKYAPSVLIIKKGKLIAYLDANSDRDYNKYQNIEDFTKWINSYIKTN